MTVPIELPSNVWGARETDPDAGLSIRVVKQYDIDADEEIIRLDILYGVKTLYPELAVRLWG
ncbi:MAG: P22 coat protein - gene protein 5 [Bacteroidetes bacterium ADurb.BinA104]|nr:MAG: P22 coat protein - gene protein 5 [Bacteroidetes bacterium ADurb.BinA104]